MCYRLLAYIYTTLLLLSSFQCCTPPLQQILDHLREVLMQVTRDLDKPILSKDDIDNVHFQTESMHRLLLRCSQLYDIDQNLIRIIRAALDVTANATKDVSCGYVSPLIRTGNKGRPSFNITKVQLEFYLSYNFSIPKISKMICVSVSTIKRRMHEFGLSSQQSYNDIEDKELDMAIHENMEKFPNCGYRRMDGLLVSQGIKVTEKRVREAMHRVDPGGVLLRAMQLTFVNRRKYKVPGVLSLWHIDGHHKLIR